MTIMEIRGRTMKIVIDIQEAVFNRAQGKDGKKLCDIDIKFICNQVANGTVLPDNVIVLEKEVAEKMFGGYYKYYNGGAEYDT